MTKNPLVTRATVAALDPSTIPFDDIVDDESARAWCRAAALDLELTAPRMRDVLDAQDPKVGS